MCVCVRACVHVRACVFVYIPCLIICSSVDGHLGSVHILAIINNVAVNIGMCISFRTGLFAFFQIYTQEWDC